MSKNRIGILRGKPIVEGDKNIVTSNEIHISDLSSSNEDNSVIYFKCNNNWSISTIIKFCSETPIFGGIHCISLMKTEIGGGSYYTILSNNASANATYLAEPFEDQEGYMYCKMFHAQLAISEFNQLTDDQLQETKAAMETFNKLNSIKEIAKFINNGNPNVAVDVESVVDITKEEYEQFYESAKQLNN